MVKVSGGNMRPRFFLPVRRGVIYHGYECWVMPLAPFVLLFYAIKSAFFAFWSDCTSAIDAWHPNE